MNITITIMSFGYLVLAILIIVILKDRKKFSSSYKNAEKIINQANQRAEKNFLKQKKYGTMKGRKKKKN